jgi:cysteine-rich repeat protein
VQRHCLLNVCGDGDVSPTRSATTATSRRRRLLPRCELEGCGNEIVDPSEDCDDGKNGDNDDGCTDVCQLPTCGDSLIQPSNGEECDDGGREQRQRRCTAGCKVGQVRRRPHPRPVEQCDDGPGNNGPGKACNADCQSNVCGDGDVGPGEACDDGNDDNTNACTNVCKQATCGDGFEQPGEQCDLGPNNDNDGACTLGCTLPVCGDGFIQPSNNETCDDSNQLDTDACTAACKTAKCGDQIVWPGMEECDDGNMDNLDACTNGCKPPAAATASRTRARPTIDCGGGGCKPCSLAGLVINEVDYDKPRQRHAEFVEILNTAAAPYSLANLALIVVNCTNNTLAAAATVNLANAGTLDPGKYLVVGPPALNVPMGVLKVNFAKATDNVENGAPDGVALIDTSTKKLIDALSYEGACAPGMLAGFAVNLVEGMVLPATTADTNTGNETLARLPNGADTNNAATDWALSKTITLGAANVP